MRVARQTKLKLITEDAADERPNLKLQLISLGGRRVYAKIWNGPRGLQVGASAGPTDMPVALRVVSQDSERLRAGTNWLIMLLA